MLVDLASEEFKERGLSRSSCPTSNDESAGNRASKETHLNGNAEEYEKEIGRCQTAEEDIGRRRGQGSQSRAERGSNDDDVP